MTILQNKYVVKYEVFGKPQIAGPYSVDEVVDQFNDIRGYEGVQNARIEPIQCDEDSVCS